MAVKLNKVTDESDIDFINSGLSAEKDPFFIKSYKRTKLNKFDKIMIKQERDDLLKEINELTKTLASRLTNKQKIDSLKRKAKSCFLLLKRSF